MIPNRLAIETALRSSESLEAAAAQLALPVPTLKQLARARGVELDILGTDLFHQPGGTSCPTPPDSRSRPPGGVRRT